MSTFALGTSAAKVQAFAGALWGVTIGSNTMALVNSDINNLGLSATLNTYYTAAWGSKTAAQTAATMVANLGITDGADGAKAYVEGQLMAVDKAVWGQTISNMLTLFNGLVGDATYGAAATAWVAQQELAVAYTGSVDIAVGAVVANQGFSLTTGMDEVPSTATLVKGIVDGTTVGNSTFTVGDEIHLTDANDTAVRLSVVDGGNAGYVYMSNVDNVNILAGDTSTINFNAGDWTNIGSVNLAGGVDGLRVEISSLEDGANLSIGAAVAGQVEGNYQSGLSVTLYNNDDGGASFVDGDVTLNAAAGASASVAFDGDNGVAVGSITGVGADASYLAVYADGVTGDVNIGDISLTDAGGATVSATFANIDGDLSIGDVTMSVQDDGDAELNVDEVSGDVVVGNVTLSGGDSDAEIVYVSAQFSDITGDLTVGDVMISAGDDARAQFTADDVSGDITLGDVTITVGDETTGTAEASLELYADSGDVTVGDVNMTVGESAALLISMTASSNIVVGNITANLADNGYYTQIFDAENVTIGDIAITGGDLYASADNSVDWNIYATASGDLTVGNISVTVGDAIAVTNSGDVSYTMHISMTNANGGDFTVGDVTMVMGDGTATASATGDGYVYATVQLSATDGTGNYEVGDVSVTVGQQSEVDIYLVSTGTSDEDLGTMTVGDITVAMGDDSDLSLTVQHSNTAATATPDLGALTVGDISIVAGTNSSIDVSITQGLWGTSGGSVGDVTIGNMSIVGEIDADVSVDIEVTNTASGDVGNVSFGDISFSLDDGGYAMLSVDVIATDGDVGNVTFGDVSIAVGVSGSIDTMSISVTGNNVGDVTIGDITKSLGENANDDDGVYVNISAATGDLGNVSIGMLNVEIAANADVDTDTFDISAVGDIGSVSFGGAHYSYGASAAGDALDFGIAATGDIGSITFGDITFDVGARAYISDILDIDISAANIGDIAFGNYEVTLGESASRTSYDDLNISATGNIGNVTFGNIIYDLQANAYTSDSVSRTIDAGGTIGNVTFGDVRMIAGTSASFQDQWNFGVYGDEGIGNVTFGDIELDGHNNANSAVHMYIDVTAASGSIGNVTFGDVDVSYAGSNNWSASLTVDVTASDDIGNIVIGDVTLMATAGTTSATGTGNFALANFHFSAGGEIGTVTVGDINLTATNTNSATFELSLTAATYGDVSIGNINFDGETKSYLQAIVNAGKADVSFGVNIMGDGSVGIAAASATTGYYLEVNGHDIVADIAINVSATSTGLYDLADVLQNVNASGDLTLGVVDLSGYALTGTTSTGEDIDVSGYFGEITVIGTSRDDTITTNDEANTLTGGDGDDEFVITTVNLGITTSTTADGIWFHTISDFAAGASNGDVILIDAANTTADFYRERTATSFDNFIDVALAAMSDGDDVIAVQVGSDVYVAVDQDGGDNIDMIIKLTGVSTSNLNFADFSVS